MTLGNILIAENEPITALGERDLLEKLGYGVAGIAASGEEAVRMCADCNPDLILMDIALDGSLDGIAAAKSINQHHDIPIIFVTARDTESYLDRTKPIEPFGYLVKPFNNTDLSSAVEIALYKHRLERKLRESEEKYRSLFEAANDAIFVVEPKTLRLLDANENAVRSLGYDREELLQLRVVDIIEPETLDFATEMVEKLLKTREMVFENVQRRKDGSTLPVEISTRVIEYGGRKVFLNIVRDITERKQAEEKQLESEETLRAFLDATSDGAVLVNKDNTIQDINETMANTNSQKESPMGPVT